MAVFRRPRIAGRFPREKRVLLSVQRMVATASGPAVWSWPQSECWFVWGSRLALAVACVVGCSSSPSSGDCLGGSGAVVASARSGRRWRRCGPWWRR